jgi:Predicted membrane protein
MSFGTALKAFWSNYRNFKGRARRSEYWFIQLFLVATNLAAAVIDLALMEGDVDRFIANGGGGIVGLIWILATIVPALAALVRRLHDTNRSGWWALIGFVPFVGTIVILVFTVSDSDQGENRYGSSPKDSTPAP